MDITTTGLSGLVTTSEAGRLLGITPNAVLQRIRRNRIPVVRVGRSVLVSLADLGASYQTWPTVPREESTAHA